MNFFHSQHPLLEAVSIFLILIILLVEGWIRFGKNGKALSKRNNKKRKTD